MKSKYAARNCYRRRHGIPLDAKQQHRLDRIAAIAKLALKATEEL